MRAKLGAARFQIGPLQIATDQVLASLVALLARWTARVAQQLHVRAKAALPEVTRVKLRRPSYGQTCVYEG